MIKYLFKKFLLIGLLLLIFGNMQGQSRYPYRYTIEPFQRWIQASYTITYEDKDSFLNGKPDSIWLVVKDTFAQNTDTFSHNDIVEVFYPERDTVLGVLFKDSVKLENSTDLRLQIWDYPNYDIYIKDTSTTKVITKVTFFRGIHHRNVMIISKIPLRKKTINAIREYKYRKGPEPWVLKKKICKLLIVI